MRAPPVGGVLALDLVYWATFTAVFAGAALPVALLWDAVAVAWPLKVGLLVALLPVFLVGLLLEVAVLKRLLPSMTPGSHPFPGSPAAVAWTLSLVLQRLVFHPWWGALVMSTASLRWLAMWSLGGRVSLRSLMSRDAEHLDVGLLVVEEGALCGARTLTAGHFIEDGVLTLGTVTLGRGAQLHVGAMVGPGCTVEAGARIGAQTALSRDVVVGEGAGIGARAEVRRDVRIGAHARVGDRCVIGAGAVIEAGAVVPADTVVPPGAAISAEPVERDTASR